MEKLKNCFPLIFTLSLVVAANSFAQGNRIRYNNQDLFLSGVNLAWMSFANDVGPAITNYDAFADFFLAIHDSGGNAVRWWLHTNGTSSPAFDGNGYVVGPGQGTIEDLKTILDIAWEREVGVILCLWSFDMLRKSNDATVLNRNTLLLTDTNYTRAYINNCLIPMVDSLKGHPAIIAWEIFNEPEGMSNEFGWSDINHVPMSAIQRFVNMCAGAIHRTDTAALVTNGAWSFKALTDVAQPSASLQKALSIEEQLAVAEGVKEHYRLDASVEEIRIHLNKLAAMANYNYYSDERLINAGQDQQGILDFYSVHYYEGIDPTNPTSISPFAHIASSWELTKPIVVAEFHMKDINGIPELYLYSTLISKGYAGALAWSWTDNAVSQKSDMLSALRFMWNNYRTDVDVNGISGEWPNVTLTSPADSSTFASGAEIAMEATASDPDGSVVAVEFYADSVKVGVDSTAPYTYCWLPTADGYYTLKAIASDDRGNQRTSNKAKILVGLPPMVRYEAERASRSGSGMSIKSDQAASGGAFVDVATNTAGTTITWTINNVLGPGNYPIAFGYNLNYDSPKGQYININGARFGEVMFEGTPKVWLEKVINVDLQAGTNTIQMEMSWGWMYVDYLAVPREVVTSVEENAQVPKQFTLEQNYPNPFNPVTKIRYFLPQASKVTLKVYDILGREITTLVNGFEGDGNHEVVFDASTLSSGIYIYKLNAGKYSAVKKCIVMK
jgi:hypothetical protein